MSFILVPKRGNEVQVNAWNWRPTLELLFSRDLVDKELHDRMGAQGAGGEVDAELANRIAQAIGEVIKGMKPGERIRADLTVTDRRKGKWVIDPDTRLDEIDANEVYSASYEWLVDFAEFCRGSHGFEVL